MRTSLKYEVVKDEFNNVTDRGAVLTITLSKNDPDEMADNFISLLNKESGYNFSNGMWEENYYQVGWIEMDRDDFENLKDDYKQVKEEIKNPTVEVEAKNIIKTLASENSIENATLILKEVDKVVEGFSEFYEIVEIPYVGDDFVIINCSTKLEINDMKIEAITVVFENDKVTSFENFEGDKKYSIEEIKESFKAVEQDETIKEVIELAKEYLEGSKEQAEEILEKLMDIGDTVRFDYFNWACDFLKGEHYEVFTNIYPHFENFVRVFDKLRIECKKTEKDFSEYEIQVGECKNENCCQCVGKCIMAELNKGEKKMEDKEKLVCELLEAYLFNEDVYENAYDLGFNALMKISQKELETYKECDISNIIGKWIL